MAIYGLVYTVVAEAGVVNETAPLQLCEHCSLGTLATYWTHDLEEHLVDE